MGMMAATIISILSRERAALMIKSFILSILFLFSIDVAIEPAQAKMTTSRAFKSGNWKGINFYRDGRFSHCQMLATYRSGSKLIFGLEPNKIMSVGVINNRWRLIKGRKESVRLLVDGRTALWSTVKVLRKNHIAAHFRTDSSTYNMLRRGRSLTIVTGDNVMKFSLRGTSRALVRLLKCTIAGVRRNRNLAYRQPAAPRGTGIFTPAPAARPRPVQPLPARPLPSRPLPRPVPLAPSPAYVAPLPAAPAPAIAAPLPAPVAPAPVVRPRTMPAIAARPAPAPAPANPFAARAPRKKKSTRLTPFSHGEWKGGSYISKRSGKFSHCYMSAGYKSGSRLVFAILRNKTMSIGVRHPKWAMKIGKQLPLDFWVDGKHAVTAKARVINTRQYASYFKSNARVFEMIRNGKVLKVGAYGTNQKFRLDGINQSLQKLLACTINAIKKERANAAPPPNPFSGAKGASSGAPRNPFSNPAPAKKPPASRKPKLGKERDA